MAELLSGIQSETGTLEGTLYDQNDLDAIIEEAGNMLLQDVGEDEGEAGDGERNLGDPKKQIKPVLYADDIAVFEKALKETGQPNRGQALMEICREYLAKR